MSDDSIERKISDLAFEYSTKKKYLRSTPEENWLRAENQLRGPKLVASDAFDKASANIKGFAELTGRVLTIITVLSALFTALGSFFLISYLHQVNAPLPPIDSSLGVFVLSLAIAFAGTLSFLLLFFFYPFVYARFDKSLYDRYRTFGFTQPLHNHFSEYSRQYLSYFLPYVLGFLASFVVMFYLKLAVGISLLAFAIGCLVAFRLLKRGSILQKPWNVFGYLLASNFLSFQWALLVLFVATLWFDQHLSGVSESRAKTLLGICILMIVVLHAFLNALVSNLRIALALSVVAVVGAIVFAPGPAFLGGTTLRLLRLGGGLPISVMLKSDPSTPIAGCLILSTGNQLILTTRKPNESISKAKEPATDVKAPDCSSASPRAEWMNSPIKEVHNSDSTVVGHERSDVLETTLLPTSKQAK